MLDDAKLLMEEAAAKQPEQRDIPIEQYDRLVKQYEKLLKTTMKISRISDIQGQTLKKQEHELHMAHENLQHAELLRRQLVSDISHELSTPMVTVQSYLKALLDGMIAPEPHVLGVLYNHMQLMDRLVKDLFQLSLLKSNQIGFRMETIPVLELVDRFNTKFGLNAKKMGIHVSFESAVRIPEGRAVHVEADAQRMEQVLSNLLYNALKFTPEDGHVRIHCELMEVPEALGGNVLMVTVSDTGIGIAEEDLPHIFERSFRGSNESKAEGSGLGLAISSEIIEQHGGAITVSSRLGEGSEFRFTLPVRITHEA
jgi:signal transduction histidine kinase